LDWRQICNGIVDCDHEEDEPVELCLKMELNECDFKNEFRCKNGQCIPISLADDSDPDCQDQSDEANQFKWNFKDYFLNICSMSTSFGCDETNHGWKQFSCGDGQVISYLGLTSKIDQDGKTCRNKRHYKYLIKLFNYSNNQTECWKSMICLTGFQYLYLNLNCLDQINVTQYCPNQFYFPPNSIVFFSL
jgi:hypothetical protein